MPEVTYPAPYSIIGRVGRVTAKSQRHEISQVVSAAIPDVDAELAPIVISLDKDWPIAGLEGQHLYNPGATPDQQRSFKIAKNPTVKLRFYDGRYFAAMMIFEKDNAEAVPRPATPADLADIGDHHLVWATGFDKPYAHQTLRGVYWEPDTHLHAHHRAGELMWPNDKRIKSLDDGQETRQEKAYQEALEDIGRYICIDGELWRSLRNEPIFRYEIGADEVTIEVSDDHHFFNHAAGDGAFRLDRYQDCREHVEDIIAARGHKPARAMKWFDNLIIAPQCQLTYQDDAEAIFLFGYETIRRLKSFMNGVGIRQASMEMQEVYRTLFEQMGHGKEERVEAIVETLLASRKVWSHSNFEAPGLELALKRWDMRPLEASGPTP